MVSNPKRDALKALREIVANQCEALSIDIGFYCSLDNAAATLSSKVNASDTWTCPRADDESASVSTEVMALSDVFAGFYDEISSQIASLPAEVDEDSPEAAWPNH